MADGFMNLQAELRAAQDYGLLAFRTLRCRMQRDALFGESAGVAYQVERFDQFVALQHVLAAEAVGIGAFLNLRAREAGGDDPGARLHFHLMNR